MRKRLLSVLLTVGLTGGLVVTGSPVEAGHADDNIVVNSIRDVAISPQNLLLGVCATTTAGECTLRAAIQLANADVQDDAHITFDIPGDGPHVITLGSDLPDIETQMDIDGTTEDACGRDICVEVNGRSNGSNHRTFFLESGGLGSPSGSVIQGLFVRNSSEDGIHVAAASNVTIRNNWIGGRQAVRGPGNNASGIRVDGSSNNSTIVGNHICDNDSEGVIVETNGNLIEDNVICRNGAAGVELSGANDNRILDNRIFANGGQGIDGLNTADNLIAENSIRRNFREGILLSATTTASGATSDGNEITRNRIFDNDDLGIELRGGANNDQDAPFLTSAELAPGGQTRVKGTLSSPADAYRIEFFSNEVCNPDRNGVPRSPAEGEGRTFIDDIVVVTDPEDDEASFDEIIAAPAPGERVITATATRGETSDTSQFSRCVEITAADIAVTKTGPAVASPGQTIFYELSVENRGNGDALDVALFDDAPEELTDIQVVDQGDFASCVVTDPEGTSAVDVSCNGSLDVAPGTGFTVVIRGTVEFATADGAVLTNRVEVTTSSLDIDTTNNTDSHDTTIDDSPGFTVEKTGDKTHVNQGESLRYTITVANPGVTHTANNLFLSDNLPSEVTFQSFVDTGPFVCVVHDPTGGSNPDFSCNGGTSLGPGEVAEVIVDVTVDLDAPFGTITNRVTVTSSNAPTISDTETTVVGGADLEVVKTGPPSAFHGEQVEFSVEVTNHGPQVASGLELVDDFDPGFENIQVSFSGGFTCVVNSSTGTHPTGRDVVCTLAAMAVGDTRTILLSAVVSDDAGFPLFNEVSVEATSPTDPDPTNNVDRIEVGGACPGFEHLTGHVHLVGTSGDDTLVATTNDPHVICGLGGDDHLEGGAGDDVIDAGSGNDFVHGRAGDDLLLGRRGNNELRGGPGNDTIRGGRDGSLIFGGPGADRVRVQGGDNLVRGGAGDPDGTGNRIFGGPGDNILVGGLGDDLLRARGDGDNILRGRGGDDRLIGAPGTNSSTRFNCGPGTDVAILRGGDNIVHPSCERVVDRT